MTIKHIRSSPGFTLIEISVVLVVIGLITAGILVGRDLIKAAEMNKISHEIESYKAAYYTFKGKYNAMPGDMMNPGAFWPALAGQGGDSNGFIDGVTIAEPALAWRELSEAGLVKITINAAEPYHVYGVLPSTRGVIYWFNTDAYGEITRIGNAISMTTFMNPWWSGPVFSSEEALRIDRKLDDGLPESGNILGLSGIDMNGDGMIDATVDCIDMDVGGHVYNTVDGDNSPRCRMMYFVDN